jgi:hypothetical protein
MIESRYWKQDLLDYAKSFRPVKNPPRWSEKLHVNFEKDIIVSFFMIRKLLESHKFSSKIKSYKAQIYCSPCKIKPNNRNFVDIQTIYDLTKEKPILKDLRFLCNQFIHGGAIFAYRKSDRNWGGIFTCSDFERAKFIYRIPVEEIIKILSLAGTDYPSSTTWEYDDKKQDYIVSSN